MKSKLFFYSGSFILGFFFSCTEPVDIGGEFCASDESCGVCDSHDECGSGVCGDEGICLSGEKIIYVSKVGNSNDGCGTKAYPCSHFEAAIDLVDTERFRIAVSEGTYDQTIEIEDKTVEIIGVRKVAVEPSLQSGQAAIRVTNGGSLTIRNILLDGNKSMTPQSVGIQCINESVMPIRPKLAIVDSEVKGFEAGLQGQGCGTINVLNSTFSENSETGISMNDASFFSMTRSTIASNGLGLALIDSEFSITNSYIVKNTDGGVFLARTKGESTFAYNTVAHNESTTNDSSGVDCKGDVNVVLEKSIIVSDDPYDSRVISGSCRIDYSLVPTSVHAENFVTGEPGFIDPVNFDFRLMPTSPAIDVVMEELSIDIDFDGDVRPLGSGYDIGADESR